MVALRDQLLVLGVVVDVVDDQGADGQDRQPRGAGRVERGHHEPRPDAPPADAVVDLGVDEAYPPPAEVIEPAEAEAPKRRRRGVTA
jgi:hypothetical protein